jgi:ribosomal protein L11 methyltransferase
VSRPRLTLRLPAADVPKAEALLELAGAETIALRDAADDPVFEPEPSTAPLWPTVVVEALFASDTEVEPLRQLLATSFHDAAVTLDSVDESTWQGRMARPVQARAIGNRLWLAPADDDDAPRGRLAVRIHMGLAFGTGEHPTTALCLEWLERHAAAETTVLDYGCGSGILALAALALGARFAYAVDNDSQALAATRANAALNGAVDRLFVCSPESLPDVAVDVLLANILAGPLVALASTFARHVVPGGMLVLSGVLEPQAAAVASAYAPFFGRLEPATRDGWVRLAGRRNAVNPPENR